MVFHLVRRVRLTTIILPDSDCNIKPDYMFNKPMPDYLNCVNRCSRDYWPEAVIRNSVNLQAEGRMAFTSQTSRPKAVKIVNSKQNLIQKEPRIPAER